MRKERGLPQPGAINQAAQQGGTSNPDKTGPEADDDVEDQATDPADAPQDDSAEGDPAPAKTASTPRARRYTTRPKK